MYVILSYDVGVKRVHKILATCRKYLMPVHRSVFEGNVTEAKLARLKRELSLAIDPQRDSVCVWRVAGPRFVGRDVIGLFDDEDEIV